MSKIYFEMTDAEKAYTHLIDTVDYTGTVIAEGIGATYKTLTNKEIIEMQAEISDHLFKASQMMSKLLSDVKVVEVDEKQDECDESTISLNMKEIARNEVEEIFKSGDLYLTGLVYDEAENVIGTSLSIKDNNDTEELSRFRHIHFYTNGNIMVSDEY